MLGVQGKPGNRKTGDGKDFFRISHAWPIQAHDMASLGIAGRIIRPECLHAPLGKVRHGIPHGMAADDLFQSDGVFKFPLGDCRLNADADAISRRNMAQPGFDRSLLFALLHLVVDFRDQGQSISNHLHLGYGRVGLGHIGDRMQEYECGRYPGFASPARMAHRRLIHTMECSGAIMLSRKSGDILYRPSNSLQAGPYTKGIFNLITRVWAFPGMGKGAVQGQCS